MLQNLLKKRIVEVQPNLFEEENNICFIDSFPYNLPRVVCDIIFDTKDDPIKPGVSYHEE